MALGHVTIRRFEDGEIYARFEESVRGEDVFVIQPTCPPVNENIMELLVMVDALRRASAGRITAVIPYYGYARQDKKHAPREPITGRLVADLLQSAGVHRILALDLHALFAQLMGEDHLVNCFEQSRTAFGVHPEGRIENDFGKLIFSVIGLGVCNHGKKALADGAAWASIASGKPGWDSRLRFGYSPLRPWRPLREGPK